MSRVGKFLQALMAMAFAALALPGIAADNKFFFAGFQTFLASGATTVDVRFFNATPPPGVSTINSIQIRLASSTPASNMTIVSAQMISPAGSVNYALTNSDKTITLTGFTGIKNNEIATFRLTLANAPSACTTFTWNAFANAGNAFPKGTDFAPTRTDLLTTYVGCAVASAPLDCPGGPNTFTFPSASGDITGLRGDNKDLTACVVVDYAVIDERANNPP